MAVLINVDILYHPIMYPVTQSQNNVSADYTVNLRIHATILSHDFNACVVQVNTGVSRNNKFVLITFRPNAKALLVDPINQFHW